MKKDGFVKLAEYLVRSYETQRRLYPQTVPQIGPLMYRRAKRLVAGPKAETANEADLEASFALFWLAYPRKVGKLDARRVWARLKPEAELVSLIVADLEKKSSSEDWLKDEGRFIPHPKTYLHNKRWEDEASFTPQKRRLVV